MLKVFALKRPSITLLACFVLLLSACSLKTIDLDNFGSNISDRYVAPMTYKEHRQQQQLFGPEGTRIAYTDTGTGPAIILLHGVPTSSWMYRKVIPGLQNNMRVISIDLLGFGSSDKPEDEDNVYSPQNQMIRIKGLLKTLNIETYSLLVHDMGGLVAWEFLRETPDAVENVIALNTIVNKAGFNHPSFKKGFFTKQLTDSYTNGLTSAVILRNTFQDLGLKGAHKLSEEECHGYVQPMREGGSSALYAFFTSLDDKMFEKLDNNMSMMQNYHGNSLIMWGALDETLTIKQIPTLQKMLHTKDENIHIYENNAHFLAEEIPEEIIEKVTRFMPKK